jgi:hypothetical protein
MPSTEWGQPGKRKKAFREEQYRRNSAPNKEVSIADGLKLVATYKKKASSRLKTFYAESLRMETKVQELIEKAKSIGVHITKLELNSVDAEYILNFRKKTKTMSFEVEATRDAYKFVGRLDITPASMQLHLNCSDLKRITTKNGFGLDHLKITYYRTLNVRDNYLPSLVGGGTYRPAEVDEEASEIPF